MSRMKYIITALVVDFDRAPQAVDPTDSRGWLKEIEANRTLLVNPDLDWAMEQLLIQQPDLDAYIVGIMSIEPVLE